MSSASRVIDPSTASSDTFFERLGRGVSLTASGQVFATGITFVAMLITARILGTARFGELGLIQSSVSMFGVFAGFGLGATATRFVAQYVQEDSRKVARIIGLTMSSGVATSALVFGVLMLAAPWIAAHLFVRPELALPLRFGAVLFSLATVEGITNATLRGFEAYGSLACVLVLKAGCALVIMPPLTYVWFVEGAVAALTVCQAFAAGVSCLLMVRACQRRRIPLRLAVPSKGELPILWQFSLPAMVASTLVVPITWAGRTLLARQTSGFVELGMFHVASQWLTLFMFIPTVVGSVLLPMIGGSDTMTKLSTAALPKLLLITTMVSLLITGVCLALTGPILAMYGPEFAAAKPIFIIVIMTATFSAMNELIGQSLLGLNAPYLRLFTTVLWAAIFVAVACLLVPRYLAVGLALARLVAASSYTAVQLPICLHQSKIRHQEFIH